MAACPSCPPVGPAGGRGARHAQGRAGEGSHRRCGGWRSADRGGGAGARGWDGVGDRWPSLSAGGEHTTGAGEHAPVLPPRTAARAWGRGGHGKHYPPPPTPGPVSCLPPELGGGREQEMGVEGPTGVPGTHRLARCQQVRALASTRLCQFPAVHTHPPLGGQRPER